MPVPNLVSPDQIIQQLFWRYATKKFDSNKTIPDSLWHALEQSLVLSPSSFGLQPWKFYVVRNPDLRQQLKECAWGQSQVTDASHLVVFAYKLGIDSKDVNPYIDHMSDVRNTPKDKLEGLESMIKGFLQDPPFPLDPDSWAIRQVYIALGFFMYSATMMGIDTCPMEGFIPAKADEVLSLQEQGFSTAVLCAAGYRASDDKYADMRKVRYDTKDVVEYID